ncbi:MAG: heavy-metal-associated domain-containing protein [Bifidobacteriaceae bacterium]|jgi:copper chaperone CopZ|nr:heavy-metal-associated domain-containing protein [Bifidobacteriaceae bacterium]
MATATYRVEGMTCDHCSKAVKEEIGALAGVSAVEVGLVPEGTSTVTVISDQPLDAAVVAAAIDEAGYQLAP